MDGQHAVLAAGVPVYALGFVDNTHLFYVGGGGAGRSGVANGILSDGASLRAAGDLKLSASEDAPMCVAVHPQDGSLVCGVNEEPARVAQGENAHVRVFGYTTTTAPAARADAAAGRAELSVTITPRAAVPSLGITDPEHYQKTATFSPDGSLLALASSDGKVQLHRYPSLEPVWTSATSAVPGGKEVYDTDFSHDGTQLAITTAAQIIVLSTAPKTTEEGGVLTYTPRVLQTIESANIGSAQRGSFRMAQFGRSTGLSVGTRDRLFALVNTTPAPGSKTRACYVAAWDADAWKMLGARKVSNRPGTVLAVSNNGRLLAVGTSDLSLSVLQARTLQENVHDFPPTCVAFAPNSRALVSGSADSTVRVRVLPSALSDELLFVLFFVLSVIFAVLIWKIQGH